MILPIKAPPKFKVIAHRGASGYAPENTFSAFDLAYKMGIYEFELDVQISSDKRIIVCHNDTLDKFGHLDISIKNTSWKDLSQLDVGSWYSPYFYKDERLVELNQLFDKYKGNITYHIEVKGNNSELIDQLIKIIIKHKLNNNVVITSFSYGALFNFIKNKNIFKLGWLNHILTKETLEKANDINLYQLCLRIDLLDRNTVQKVHSKNINVRAWGLNGERADVINYINKTIDIGCDGATLNWPDWVTSKDV